MFFQSLKIYITLIPTFTHYETLFLNCLMMKVYQKHVKFYYNHIRWTHIQEVLFFHAAIVCFFEGQNVTLLTVTLLTMIF